jgi:hypothetical protein
MTTQQSLFTEQRGADFSPCQKYRYRLWRIWDDGPLLNFCMLNPSVAGHVDNDPTVERCERRARMWGYGGLLVTNIFAYCATDPQDMKAAGDPIGPGNDEAIIGAILNPRGVFVICAWGSHGTHMGRGRQVLELLKSHTIATYCLRVNSDGQPAHPLYLPFKLEPAPYTLTKDLSP